MNFGAISLKLLDSLPTTAGRSERINASLKILRTLRDELPSECTHRLAQKLRAVWAELLSSPDTTLDERKQLSAAAADLRKIDPRRTRAAVKEGSATDGDLLASCPTGVAMVPAGTDEWDTDGRLSNDEAFRLTDVERPFQVCERGQFVLMPGANVQAMFAAALGDRAFNVTNLQKLHRRLKDNFSSGGVSLTSGPLFSELVRVLTEQGVLPIVDLEQNYGAKLLAELCGRA